MTPRKFFVKCTVFNPGDDPERDPHREWERKTRKYGPKC